MPNIEREIFAVCGLIFVGSYPMGSAAFRPNQVRPVRPTVAVDRGANGPPREDPIATAPGSVSWAREDLRAQIAELQQQLVSAHADRSALETRATEAEGEVSETELSSIFLTPSALSTYRVYRVSFVHSPQPRPPQCII